MNFELPEELRMLRDMSCKFANAEFTPFSRECDEEERYTPEIRKKAAENGLVGAWIPEEYGGAGVGILGNTIITEEISRVDMGIRASDTAEIALEDVTVPRENLVGEEKKGFRQLMHFFDVTRVMVAGQAVGLSQSCLDESIKYSKERTAFGSPIGIFQSTMTKLTEMAIRIEALRNLVYKVYR